MNPNKDWILIPDFKKYLLNINTLEVHSNNVNRVMKKLHQRSSGLYGYQLWADEKKQFVSEPHLGAIAARFNLRRIRDEMSAVNTGTPKTGDFLVGSINKLTGVFSNTDFPARHLTASLAKKEAARLASVHRERKFVVLEVKGVVSVDEVKWE